MASVPSISQLAEGIQSSDRASIGRAITLVESYRPDHRALSQELLTQLLPFAGNAHRVGITGVPGVGKSTFIENLGTKLVEDDHKVAVDEALKQILEKLVFLQREFIRWYANCLLVLL